jgi:hypothetical protein
MGNIKEVRRSKIDFGDVDLDNNERIGVEMEIEL